jgi:acylphosphatase
MSDAAASAVRVVVSGRVQGVWFRAWTVETATGLGLAGWVRNRADGSVEALFAGPADAVETMIARCHDGPPAAQVDAVRATPADPPDEAGFRQLPTV